MPKIYAPVRGSAEAAYGNPDTSGIRLNVIKGDHEWNVLLQ
jgi:hypothetical protein